MHKHTQKCTLQYAGVERQVAEKVQFCHLSFSYKTLVKDSLPTEHFLS